ncbi:MAG: nitroreductase family protein [Aestuariivirgaceae bacterium]
MVRVNDGVAADRLNDTSDTLSLLETRRSASAKAMQGPGPTAAQLAQLLRVAVRVPDHGKLTPWRFVLFEGEARAAAGDILAARWHALYPDHGEAMLNEQRAMLMRAPTVLCVVSAAQPHPKIPIWEQQLSAGAVCQNILIAATAMGIGCQWITGWYAFDEAVLRQFDIKADEKVAGFVYLGTPQDAVTDRPRPEPDDLLTRWQG